VPMPYRHVLVVCDGSSEGYEAVRAASELAVRDHALLTVAAVAELVRPNRGCQFGTSTWNEVLLDAAAADLDRARRVVESPARFTVLSGNVALAIAAAEEELSCDVIVVPERPRRRLSRILRRDHTKAVRGRTHCPVMTLNRHTVRGGNDGAKPAGGLSASR
jgi:nucleotide-binding universal stress UspA family protein